MDINEITGSLNSLPLGLSRFELTNFLLERHPTPARQLAEVMLEIERINGRLNRNQFDDDREYKMLEQRYDMLSEWYDSMSADERIAILSAYENEESAYWTNVLGRKAAIEILTAGKASFDTMDRMSLLSSEDFEQAVRICTRYARMIADLTQIAENTVSAPTNGVASSDF